MRRKHDVHIPANALLLLRNIFKLPGLRHIVGVELSSALPRVR